MTVTNSPTVEGQAIKACKRMILGEAILVAKVVRDAIAKILGGRSCAQGEEMGKARGIPLTELKRAHGRSVRTRMRAAGSIRGVQFR